MAASISKVRCVNHAFNFTLKFLVRSFSVNEIFWGKGEPKIYTKTGDKGTTSLFTGERRPKDDLIFEALGTTDELSSSIGLAREFCLDANNSQIIKDLEEIQCNLQDLGSHVATPLTSSSDKHKSRTEFTASIQDLEKKIDEYTEQLPPLRNFILASGGKSSAALHVTRAVCRRLERSLLPILERGDINDDVYKYVNRLSDFLFTAARFAANFEGKTESIYQRKLKSVKSN